MPVAVLTQFAFRVAASLFAAPPESDTHTSPDADVSVTSTGTDTDDATAEAEAARALDAASPAVPPVAPTPANAPSSDDGRAPSVDGASRTAATAAPGTSNQGEPTPPIQVPAEEPSSPSAAKTSERFDFGKHKRSSPFDADGSAWKPGKGLELRTKDDRFALTIRARIQLLAQFQRDPTASPEDTGDSREWQSGLSIRRGRVVLSGHVFTEDFGYTIQFNFAPADVGFDPPGSRNTYIRDAYVTWKRWKNMEVQVGQQKVPFNRERLDSSGDQSMPDRSANNAEFNLDRDLGVLIRSRDLAKLGYLGYQAGVFTGEGRDSPALTDLGYLYVAKAELYPLGVTDDIGMVDFERRKKPWMVAALGYAYHDEAKRDRGILGANYADGGSADAHNALAETRFKWRGFVFSSELMARFSTRKRGAAVDDMGVPVPTERPRDGVGGLIQASYMVPVIPLEFTGRYTRLMPISGVLHDLRSALPDQHEAGGGVSWYFFGHPLKLQLDYAHTWLGLDDAGSGTARELDRVRLQLQFSF